MEKLNSNNNHEFSATSPQQLLDNTAPNNPTSFINNADGIYSGSFSPEQQNNNNDNNWREYRNTSIVTSEMFTHSDIPSLDHSVNNSQNFDTMYEHQIPNFQPENQFNYNHHHRGSLPMIHNPGGGDPFNPHLSNLPNTVNNNAPPYLRRYTEGSIPRYGGRKQRMNSSSSSNSNSNKGEEDDQNMNDEEGKRKHFLERNRQAALKCRQRKKQWLNNLQHRVEFLSTDNEQLQSQATMLREEVINLKTLLLAHRDCKVAQANGTTMHMIQSVSSNALQFQNSVLPPSSVPNNHHIQQRFQHPTD